MTELRDIYNAESGAFDYPEDDDAIVDTCVICREEREGYEDEWGHICRDCRADFARRQVEEDRASAERHEREMAWMEEELAGSAPDNEPDDYLNSEYDGDGFDTDNIPTGG